MNLLVTALPVTPEDLLLMPDEPSFELVGGRLLERKMGSESNWIAGRLFRFLGNYCDQANLGWVWPNDNGYQCFPDSPNHVRKPDVSFIRLGRLPNERPARGFERIAPDLAVEVTSPNDLMAEVEEKIELYLRAGVRLVWVVIPETRTVRVCRPNGSDTRLHEADTLTGEDIIPGFQCLVRDLFPPPLLSASASS